MSRILFIVAAIAVIAYLLLDRASNDDEANTTARLATFNLADVDDVTLQRADGTIHLVRQDSVWRMTVPVQDIAEPTAVIPLLPALEHADVARNLGATDDLAPFGLDPPEVRITLRSGTNTLLEAELGKRTADEGWTYARSGSPDLLLVPTDVGRAANLPVNAYRNQRILDFQTHDITRYELRGPDHSTAWMRRAASWCSVESGDTIAGDSVAVEAVLRRLRGLRVASFVVDADTALVEPVTTLTLWQSGDARFAVLRFWRREYRWFAHVDRYHRTVVIDDDVSDLVAHTTTELRERRLLQFDPLKAGQIELSGKNFSGTLVRMGGVWSSPNPAQPPLDPDKTADFVRMLRAFKWDMPATGPGPSSFTEGLHVLVRGEDGAILDEMHALSIGGSQWYVTSRSSPAGSMIDRLKLVILEARMAEIFGRASFAH